MTYNKAELETKAVEIIKTAKIVFLDDLYSKLGISKQTFYNYKLYELDSIKDGIRENKSNLKEQLRDKWLSSDNATLQIALYKLLSNSEEIERLTQRKPEPKAWIEGLEKTIYDED